MAATDSARTEPLVVIVDDDPKGRSRRAKALTSRGCRVVPAGSREEAEVILSDTPGIDLLLTDINLAGVDRPPNKDGIALARHVRGEINDQLAIIGYSSAYTENEITQEERHLFDLTSPKAHRVPSQVREFNDQCVTLARYRMAERRKQSSELLHQFSGQDMRHDMPTHRSRSASLKASSPGDIEDLIVDAGYELRLITSDVFRELAQPVLLWLRRSDDEVAVEVYGQGSLYAVDKSEDTAIANLIRLMDGFNRDFRALPEHRKPIGPAKRLSDFLSTVLR